MPEEQVFRKRHAADMQASSVSVDESRRNHLTLLAQKVAAKHFEVYWQRGLNGAPARWSKGVEKCWKLGVAAAIAATQRELRTVCSQTATDEQLLTYMREKAVREHGQVVNGHKFKRPPSAAILAHYAALGEVWQERYGPHYKAGTVPDDIKELLSAPVVAAPPTPSPLRPMQRSLEDQEDHALQQKRPRTDSNNSQGDMTSSKGLLSSISSQALAAWVPPDTDLRDTDVDSSGGTFLCDGPFDDVACDTLPARRGAASSSYRSMQWPFASQQQGAHDLDLPLQFHAALADDHPSEALAAPEEAVCHRHGCLDSSPSRAGSARHSPRAFPPSTLGTVQACPGHYLLTQRLVKLEADLVTAIQQHRASSAELARKLARLERHMDSLGRPKHEECCFDILDASPIFGDLYRD